MQALREEAGQVAQSRVNQGEQYNKENPAVNIKHLIKVKTSHVSATNLAEPHPGVIEQD